MTLFKFIPVSYNYIEIFINYEYLVSNRLAQSINRKVIIGLDALYDVACEDCIKVMAGRGGFEPPEV